MLAPVPASAPDILWIATTQWRARALGCAGDPDARTPHLDRLAREGVRCTAAVTPHPFGPFARAALLTGVPSPANGVRDYFDALPSGARTVAHVLGDSGYDTAWFGKWHLAPRDPAAPLVGEAHARQVVPPEGRGGFGLWEGFESGFLLNDPWLHGTRLPEPVRFPGYQSDVLCERAGAWIEERRSRRDAAPWFCVVSLEAPHPPYDAPAPAPRPDALALTLPPNVPRGGEAEARARHELAGYHAHIAATDRAIGALLDRVRARSCGGRDTRVVFFSVHGDMHGAHGLFRKGWPHEESVGVPLILWSSAGGPAGEEARPVSLLELPAMAQAWARGGAWAPSGNAVSISMPSVVRLPHQCDRTWHGWRGESWKVILGDDGEPWLACDLARDPWELDNLATDPRGASLVARARALQAGRPACS